MTLHTDVSEAGPFERLLTITLDEAELEDAKNAAARKLSREIKIKGFRPGKAPRAIVERMVGPESVRGEAIDESLGEFVGSALGETDLEPVTTPSVSDIRDRDGGGVEIDVKIVLWPTVTEVPSYARSIEVEVPDVDDDELNDQIDRVRSQYAELEDVDRPADTGDFVVVNLSATADGQPVEEVAASDLQYEVGSGSYIPGLDDILVGAAAGDIKMGPATLPDGFGEHGGAEVTLRALVKGVQTRKLPELTDEWVTDVSEFETVEELTERLGESIRGMKLQTARGQYRDDLIEAILADLELELPDALVETEMESSLHNLARGLQGQGLDLATYLSVTGQDQEAFIADVRTDADRSLRTRILLEAIAAAESIEATEEDITAALEAMSDNAGRSADEVRTALEANGQMSALTGDILRRKALERVVEASTPIDGDGNPLDLTLPEPVDEDGDQDEAVESPSEVPDELPEEPAAVGAAAVEAAANEPIAGAATDEDDGDTLQEQAAEESAGDQS